MNEFVILIERATGAISFPSANKRTFFFLASNVAVLGIRPLRHCPTVPNWYYAVARLLCLKGITVRGCIVIARGEKFCPSLISMSMAAKLRDT